MFRQSKKGLTISEILEICVQGKVPPASVCRKVPQAVRENAVFVVDIKDAVPHRDLSADDNDVYSKHSSPCEKVRADFRDDGSVERVEVVSSAECDDINDVYNVRRQYSWHHTTKAFSRVITKVEINGFLAKYAIVQYKAPANANQLSLRAHGNSQKKNEAYYRTKPSVLKKARAAAQANERPKRIITSIEQDVGGAANMNSPGDIIRNREQVYNVCRNIEGRQRSRNTGPSQRPDFIKLMNLMQQDDFLRDVSFGVKSRRGVKHMAPKTFAMTDTQMMWVKTYCSGDRPKSQIGIDMTYNMGPFYVTTLTFPHPMFVYRNKPSKHPTTLAAMMTSVTKEREDYEYLAGSLFRKGIKSLTYGTDGEQALEQAFENIFPIGDAPVSETTRNIHLRCFTHVEVDIKAKLQKLKVSAMEQKRICSQILGGEKDGTRIKGLVDCERKESFDTSLVLMGLTWPPEFSQWMSSSKGRIRPLTETLKLCMMKPTRVAAGLGNPPNKWHNQGTEALHQVMKEEAKGEARDQATIHENVNTRVVVQQKSEFIKALYGMGEYRLAPEFTNVGVDPLRWSQMTQEQRAAYVKKVLGGGLIGEEPAEEVAPQKLSISITESGLANQLAAQVLSDIWKKAEIILSRFKVIPLEKENFCVTEDDKAFTVETKRGKTTCSGCGTSAATGGICQHSVAVAQSRGTLREHIERYKK